MERGKILRKCEVRSAEGEKLAPPVRSSATPRQATGISCRKQGYNLPKMKASKRWSIVLIAVMFVSTLVTILRLTSRISANTFLVAIVILNISLVLKALLELKNLKRHGNQ